MPLILETDSYCFRDKSSTQPVCPNYVHLRHLALDQSFAHSNQSGLLFLKIKPARSIGSYNARSLPFSEGKKRKMFRCYYNNSFGLHVRLIVFEPFLPIID